MSNMEKRYRNKIIIIAIFLLQPFSLNTPHPPSPRPPAPHPITPSLSKNSTHFFLN